MSRTGNGEYVAPNSSWNPAINNVLATAGDWQALLNDIVAALTQSVSRDGQSPMTGNLPMGNNKIVGLAAGTATTDAATWAQLFGASTQADIASAATTDIGVQNTSFLRVTGTTTITSFGTSYRGPRFLTFADAVTLTNSSTLVLPGNANITTAAGDSLIVIPGATSGTADKWIVVAYQSGVPLSTSTVYNKAQVDALLGTAVGAGSIIHVAMNTAPTGYLKANGAAVSRTTYSALFAAIGTTFGAGDGSTTFLLPDLRGEFIRGWADGRAVDTGRGFGSFQDQAFASHSHTTTNNNAFASSVASDSTFAYARADKNLAAGTTFSTAASGGAETRPRNVALLACIKF